MYPLTEEIRLEKLASPDWTLFLSSLLSVGTPVYSHEKLSEIWGLPGNLVSGTPVKTF